VEIKERKKVETLIKNKQESVISRIMLQRKGNVPVKKKKRRNRSRQ
jgi:hypothetical protein